MSMRDSCEIFWSDIAATLRGALSPVDPSLVGVASRTVNALEALGHGNGVEDDAAVGSTLAQDVGAAARDAGATGPADAPVAGCPACKVAIVVGHNSSGQGAYSATIGESEFPYNSDIAERTVAKIAAAGRGAVEAQIFYRQAGLGYEAQMAGVYGEVAQFLETVPAASRIAIELHFNAAAPSADYALTIYKGDANFARQASDRMAAIYGTDSPKVWHWQSNDRGQATFRNGPTNTYLMEPFFGSHERSAEIAATTEGRDGLAQVYADLLLAWVAAR